MVFFSEEISPASTGYPSVATDLCGLPVLCQWWLPEVPDVSCVPVWHQAY